MELDPQRETVHTGRAGQKSSRSARREEVKNPVEF